MERSTDGQRLVRDLLLMVKEWNGECASEYPPQLIASVVFLFLFVRLQTHLPVSISKLFLHSFKFLVFRKFTISVVGAAHFPIKRGEAKMGDGIGRLECHGLFQKRERLFRLVHGHQRSWRGRPAHPNRWAQA